jgi:hypothetical protein
MGGHSLAEEGAHGVAKETIKLTTYANPRSFVLAEIHKNHRN